MRDVDLDNGFIRERVENEKRVRRVLATDRLGSSGVKKNIFVVFKVVERRAVACGLRRY